MRFILNHFSQGYVDINYTLTGINTLKLLIISNS